MQTPAVNEEVAEPYAFSLALLAMAGCVDAIGFTRWGGTFASFMSGNTTKLATAAAEDRFDAVKTLAAVILSFVIGVIIGELLRTCASQRPRTATLTVEALLLAFVAGLTAHTQGLAVLCLLAFAMGVQNAVIHRGKEVGLALTYVTGVLVKLGRAVSDTVTARGRSAMILLHLGQWFALAGGAAIGCILARRSLPIAVTVVCVAAAILLGISVALDNDRAHTPEDHNR